jgi:hypothetical protein
MLQLCVCFEEQQPGVGLGAAGAMLLALGHVGAVWHVAGVYVLQCAIIILVLPETQHTMYVLAH